MKSPIFALLLINSALSLRFAFGETKDEYLKKRNQFIQEEKIGITGGKIKLSDAEKKVNHFLMDLKLAEINGAKHNDTIFPPETHFFQAKPVIDASSVFHLIRKMPKGGALHIHDSAIVDVHWLIKRATYDPNCYMCTDDEGQLHFHFFPEQPGNGSQTGHTLYFETNDESHSCDGSSSTACTDCGDHCSKPDCQWESVVRVRSLSASSTEFDEKLYRAMTMTVDHPEVAYKTQNMAWTKFRSLFAASEGLYTHAPVFVDYCYESLTEFYNDNVQYMEIRVLLLQTYELDGTLHDGDWAMDVYQKCFSSFQKKNPDFSGVKVIFSSIRSMDESRILSDIKIGMEYMKKYPSILAGYDLVSQEDKGHSLYYFLDALLLPSQTGIPLPYFFHAGETDWEGLSVDDNLIDAVLLNTTRIGHAFAITKHPKVMAMVVEKGIALEINPISNQVLKLVDDLRDHPAVSLLAQDFPLVVSSDDPALWGATGLSHDFYEMFMGLGGAWADLRTLKKLALNSLMYSAMTNSERTVALKIWEKKWEGFINYTIITHHL